MLDADTTSVNILFVVPHDVYSNFKLPEEVNQDVGFEVAATLVDRSDVYALENCFANFTYLFRRRSNS
jgi:hypothetical protein